MRVDVSFTPEDRERAQEEWERRLEERERRLDLWGRFDPRDWDVDDELREAA